MEPFLQRARSTDIASLIGVGCLVAFFLDGQEFTYNWTLLLFGLIALTSDSISAVSQRWYLIIIAVTSVFDLFAFLGGRATWPFQAVFVLVVLAVKVAIFVNGLDRLRARGDDITFPGGFGPPGFLARPFGGSSWGQGQTLGSGPDPELGHAAPGVPGAFPNPAYQAGGIGVGGTSGGRAGNMPSSSSSSGGAFPSSGGYRLGGDEGESRSQGPKTHNGYEQIQ